jgi:hypothetical protein
LAEWLHFRYASTMAGNLADPEYEPTDEELRELTRGALQDAMQRRKLAMERFWDDLRRKQIELRKGL